MGTEFFFQVDWIHGPRSFGTGWLHEYWIGLGRVRVGLNSRLSDDGTYKKECCAGVYSFTKKLATYLRVLRPLIFRT